MLLVESALKRAQWTKGYWSLVFDHGGTRVPLFLSAPCLYHDHLVPVFSDVLDHLDSPSLLCAEDRPSFIDLLASNPSLRPTRMPRTL